MSEVGLLLDHLVFTIVLPPRQLQVFRNGVVDSSNHVEHFRHEDQLLTCLLS